MADSPRMIAIDMDGTLVHPGGYVSVANQAALRRARAAGAKIVIATGRRHSYAMKILRTVPMEPDDIVLSSNGTVARTVGGRLLFRLPMPMDIALWLCEALGEFRNAFVLTFDLLGPGGQDVNGALVLEELDELHGSIRSWMDANAAYIKRVKPIEDALITPPGEEPVLPIQAMLCGTMERMHRAEELLSASHEGQVSLFRTEYPGRDLCILDILPGGCSKAAGLRLLMQADGLTEDDLMSLGDNWNDEPMLRLARWPVLMDNAPETLKMLGRQQGWNIAGHHAEDGVAAAIAEHFPG